MGTIQKKLGKPNMGIQQSRVTFLTKCHVALLNKNIAPMPDKKLADKKKLAAFTPCLEIPYTAFFID